MTVPTYVLLGLLIAVVFALVRRPLREYLRMRGDRVVACPENEQTVSVRVDAGRAALDSAVGHQRLRLESCTRWPEKAGCGQECLKQIEAQPTDCLVRTKVTRWYADKTCAICGVALGQVDWTEHKPALRAPDGATLEWSSVLPEKLYEIMASHAAVCWDCHIAETFRRVRPDLVIDNPHTSPTRH